MNFFRDNTMREEWEATVAARIENDRVYAAKAQAAAEYARSAAVESRERAAMCAAAGNFDDAAKHAAQAEEADARAAAADEVYAKAYASSNRYVPPLPPLLPELAGWGPMIREIAKRNREYRVWVDSIVVDPPKKNA